MIRLSQNITVKATTKPIITPNEFVIAVNVLLPEEVVAVAVAVATAVVGVAVGASCGPVVSIVVSICVICVIAGQMPLSKNA